jgi:hypothetical protein
MRTRRHRMLATALDELETLDGAVDVVLIPPGGGDGEVSDQEEGDEEVTEAAGEIKEVAGEVELHVGNNDEDQPETTGSGKRRGEVPKWRAADKLIPVQGTAPITLADAHPVLVAAEPLTLFRLMFDDDLVKLIIEQSIMFAGQCNAPDFTLTAQDLDTFIGLLMYTGYNRLPRQRMYWSHDVDLKNDFVSNAMTRNRFEQIKKYLHFADNTNLEQGNKMAKVQPLYDHVNRVLLQFGVWAESLAIDEEMVPYFGHHSCKMSLRMKPVRFGYKLWVLASSSGFPFKVEIYTGKGTGGAVGGDADMPPGMGPGVVCRLLEAVDDPNLHRVTFDNLFTSYDLLAFLSKKGFRATGTARENRLKKCPLPPQALAEKAKRGTYWMVSDERVRAVKWKDNKAVTVASNHDGINPIAAAPRWSREEQKRVNVDQPRLIHNYNQDMGGVDLVDNALSDMRPVIHWKKWYGPLIVNAFGLLRVAAWRLHREVGGSWTSWPSRGSS